MAKASKDQREILKPGNTDLCEVYNDDMRRAQSLKKHMPSNRVFRVAGRMLKASSDPVRVRLLYALSHSELCVCEMAHLLSMSLPAVSHHLRILRDADLVEFRKEGRLVFYRLRDEHLNGAVKHLVNIFAEQEKGGEA